MRIFPAPSRHRRHLPVVTAIAVVLLLSPSVLAQNQLSNFAPSGQLAIYLETASASTLDSTGAINRIGLVGERDTIWLQPRTLRSGGDQQSGQRLLLDAQTRAGFLRQLLIERDDLQAVTDSGLVTLVAIPATAAVSVNSAIGVGRCLTLFLNQSSPLLNGAASTYAVSYALHQPQMPPAQSLVFVTNSESGNITVIDRYSRKVVRVIRAGEQPRGMAYSPQTRQLLVANYGSHSLSVIDPGSLEVIKTVMLNWEDGPERLAISPELGLTLVLNIDSYTVSVLDAGSYQELYRLGLSFKPAALAVDSDHGLLYVTGESAGEIAVYDLHSHENTANLTVGTAPDEILVTDPGNVIVVSDSRQRTVSFLDASGKPTRFLEVCAPAAGLAYDPSSRRLFVAAAACNEIGILQTGSDLDIGSIPLPAAPDNLTLDPERRDLWISLPSLSQVKVVNVNSRKIVATIEVGSGPYMICMVE